MYLSEGPHFSECVGASPTFLAKGVSFIGPFKIFLVITAYIYIRDSRDFATICWTMY
jgi:hypothetical protein